jgi:hypothetical protein
MKINEKILSEFDNLIAIGKRLIDNKLKRSVPFTVERVKGTTIFGYEDKETLTGIKNTYRIPTPNALRWKTSCLFFIKKVYGRDIHYISFEQQSTKFEADNNVGSVSKSLGVLNAAKDDYQKSYLFNTQTLIEAEIFDDLLEQSEHLLSQGYFQASAVIAGCVLEDALRKLCIKNNITLPAKPKMDLMNADLARANVYNLLKQKQITALADLRNKAAHNQGGFTKEDVEDMIRNVRRFMEDYFS